MTTQTSVDAADEIGRALDSFARGAIDFHSLNARIDVVLNEHPDARATALRLIDEQRPTGALQRAFFRVLKERIADGHAYGQASGEDADDAPHAAPDDAEPTPTPAFRVRSDDASIPPETHFDTGLPFAATLRESTRPLFARDDVSRDDGARKAHDDAPPAPARFPFEVVEPPPPAEPVVGEAAAESAAEAFDAAARDDVPESVAEAAPPPEEASPGPPIRPPGLEAADIPGDVPDAGAAVADDVPDTGEAVAADADSDVAPAIEAPAAPPEPPRPETVLRAAPPRRPVSRRARRGPPRARVPDPTVPFEDSPLDLSFPFSDPPEERFVRRVRPVRPMFDEAPPVAPAASDAPPRARPGPEDPGDIVPERREVRHGRRRESVPVMLAVIVAAIAAWFFKDPVGGRLAEEGEVAVPLTTPPGEPGSTASGDVAAPLAPVGETETTAPTAEAVRDEPDVTAEAATPAAPPIATATPEPDARAAAPPATDEKTAAEPRPELARAPAAPTSQPPAETTAQAPASPATAEPRRPGPALPDGRRAFGAPAPPTRTQQTETAAPPAADRATTAAAPAPAPAARDVPARASARFRIAAPSFTVREDQTMVAITLVRSGALNAPATITWWVNPGTARPDEDYADFGRRAEAFGPGETRRTIYVPITSDTLPEPEETFEVEIGEPQIGASFDGVTSATVTIVDDD